LWRSKVPLGYARRAVRSPTNDGRETRMAFTFGLEQEDGTPADPPVLRDRVPGLPVRYRRGDCRLGLNTHWPGALETGRER
jgi:hypothetical protein